MTHTVEQIKNALHTLQSQLDESTAAYNDDADRTRAKITKLREWLWANEPHTAESMIAEVVGLRDERSALKAQYDRADKVLKDAMELREAALLQTINDVGVNSLRGDTGTAYVQVKTRSSCSDWPSLWQYIKDNDRFDLLEKRVAQKAITDMIEEGDELPPGISTFTERVVTIRRS